MGVVCGEKGVGVNREPTSRDYIAGMLDGDVIFVSICFMIIYIIKNLDDDWNVMLILCLYNASVFLIMFLYRVTICKYTTET